MKSVNMSVVCTVVFGAVTALSNFVRQLLLSRDKNLNDEAQQRALAHETKELEKLCLHLQSNRRFDSHYQVLGANKEAVQALDQKIESVLNRKLALIHRYAQMTLKEASVIVDGQQATERKAVCDLLQDEIKREIGVFDRELQALQANRASICGENHDLEEHLLAYEQSRNERLDRLYQDHMALLEKIYLRYIPNLEQTGTHKAPPVQFLARCFKISDSISPNKLANERLYRVSVADIEKDINGANDDLDCDEFVAETSFLHEAL